MTSDTPGAEQAVVKAFEEAASNREDTAVWLSTIGPLMHRAPGTDTPRWYGRWRASNGGLEELFQLKISTVPDWPHELELVFHLMGYPLTASLLETDRVLDGDAAIAAQNRNSMLPLFGQIESALEIPAGEATWSIDGEFRSDYPEDFAHLERALLQLAKR